MEETPGPTGLPEDEQEPTPMGIDEDTEQEKEQPGPEAMPGIQEDEPDVSG